MFYRFKPFTGPVSYTFKDPDTGREFEEKSKAELIERISAYRKQNNLEELEHMGFVLENYWCSLPDNMNNCVPVEKLKRGLIGYIKGGIALLANLTYKNPVHQVVADTRAKICTGCQLNVFPDQGGFIAWSNQIAEASVGDRKSKYHEELGQCGGCSCPLRAKVWYGGRIELTKEQESVMREAKPECWQLPENLNG